MKKTLLAHLMLLALLAPCAYEVRAQAEELPSLVVMIVVDQLDGDMLDTYDAVLEGGFRRFMSEGYRFTEASHAHAMTETAPGHATLATGVHPYRHGIVANNWRQRVGFDWANMYAVGDPDVRIVGFENEAVLEGRSPANFLRGGLADWVVEQDSDARTVSISKKDRAAVSMAARTDENVWWLLDQLGLFITSTYYTDSYPNWIRRFNRDVMPRFTADTVWTSQVPAGAEQLGVADEAPWEGDGEHTTFPHLARLEVPSGDDQGRNIWLFEQPRVDNVVLELAKRAIDELDLGQRDDHTDFLAVSFSALDRVGHAYGPLSQEAFSTIVNLDGVLADLLDYLDEEVGEGRWVAGLAGDHGAADIPERAQALGIRDARRVDERELYAEMSGALQEAASGGGSPEEIAARIANLVEERGFVEAAYTHQELLAGGEPADSFAVLYRHSLIDGRAWGVLSRFGVEVRYPEGTLVTTYPTGTNHGTPYWYDRHVEMMWLGAGVPAGSSDEGVYTVDFAPTLAALGGIGTPDDLDGRPLF